MLCVRLVHPGAAPPPLFPFDEPPGALLLGSRPLARLQSEECGGTVVDVPLGAALPAEARVAFAAHTVFSRETVQALLLAAGDGIAQAAIQRGTPLWHAAARLRREDDGDRTIELYAGDLTRLSTARPVAVCSDSGAAHVRVPPYGRPPHLLQLPRVTHLGGDVLHWLDALELSLAALQTDLLRGPRTGDADVHPTAFVENSIIEDGARLEPHAAVINSYIGKDVLIADHTVIEGCVIGDGCRTLVDTSLRRCVAMPGSTLSNLGLSDVIVGRNAFITTAVATFGPAPGEDVVVEGKDTGRAVLGGAFGARAVLGARALLRAGVAIPAGALIVAKPEEAVAKFDDAGLEKANMMRGDRSRDV